MGKKVMIVDDDPVIRMIVSEYLSSKGHEVDAISTGEEALTKLKNSSPDFLILDLIMPNMNGIEFLENLKLAQAKNPAKNTFKIIMLSANNESDSAESLKNLNVDEYLQKPFQIKDLLDAVTLDPD